MTPDEEQEILDDWRDNGWGIFLGSRKWLALFMDFGHGEGEWHGHIGIYLLERTLSVSVGGPWPKPRPGEPQP